MLLDTEDFRKEVALRTWHRFSLGVLKQAQRQSQPSPLLTSSRAPLYGTGLIVFMMGYAIVGSRNKYCVRGGTGFDCMVPPEYWPWAVHFAEWMNKRHSSGSGTNADHAGLRRLMLDNPYDAPLGALVVVAPLSPGTGDPNAGDIAVRGPGDTFWNDGPMSYRGRHLWPPSRGGVVGKFATDI